MKKISIIMVFILIIGMISMVSAEDVFDKVLYVSSNGSNSNSGTSESEPLKTIAMAYGKLGMSTRIVLLDDTTYYEPTSLYSGDLVIEGKTNSIKLILPSAVNLKGNLKIDNVALSGTSTIQANGYRLEIGVGVTSDSRLKVYGGGSAGECESTDIRLYGGQYSTIFGGGNGKPIAEDTHVIVGGNVNPNDGINDSVSNISPCYIYGGGEWAAVNGKTNVIFEGSAVAYFLVGSGKGSSGTAKDTNIFINGGKVMNVYGGSADSELVGCDTHITMTGGLAEALFGGCQSKPMSGNAYIALKGGEVSRRVYSGCYNNCENQGSILPKYVWKTAHYVKGNTTISIYPDVKLSTGNGLSGTNAMDRGVYAGSRHKNSSANENNTVIFLEGCYSKMKSALGNQDIVNITLVKSHTNYTVSATSGGAVYGTGEKGKVIVEPDKGMYALMNNNIYGREIVEIGTSASITFEKNFSVDIFNIEEVEGKIMVSSHITAKNAFGAKNPRMILALYDGDMAVGVKEVYIEDGIAEALIEAERETDGEHNYKARLMIVVDEVVPVIESIEKTLDM